MVVINSGAVKEPCSTSGTLLLSLIMAIDMFYGETFIRLCIQVVERQPSLLLVSSVCVELSA